MKDKFGREIDYLRVSVTDKCNLRCIYCMNEKESDFWENDNKLTDNEIYRVIRETTKIGIKKIRITGGEPLIRPGIVELIGGINKITEVEEIYMTTNGVLLEDKVEDLVKNGLKGVNISLDSLKSERFKFLTRKGQLSKVLNAIDKCLEFNLKIKINIVIVNDINKDEVLDFVELTREKKIDIRFIELMPMGVAINYKGVNNKEILDIIHSNYNDILEVKRDKRDGPAKYIKIKYGQGRIGFINAISNCFCKECNRVRLTADGFLKPCLHFDYGVDLRRLLRDGITNEALNEVIHESIYNKPERHLFLEKCNHKESKFMNQIGG